MVGGGSVSGDEGLLALMMDFREVMLTSPPEGLGTNVSYERIWVI